MFEVLHRVGDEEFAAIDAGFGEGAIQNLSCRANERMAGEIFLIAWLFADERETLSVREQETLTAEEFQRYQENADSSTRRLVVVRRDGPDGAILESPKDDDSATLFGGATPLDE